MTISSDISCVVIAVFFLVASLIEPINIPQNTVIRQAAINKKATTNHNEIWNLLIAPSNIMGIWLLNSQVLS